MARRWILFGPLAELHRRRFPEAVSAAGSLSQGVSGIRTCPEGHMMVLLCLIEDCMDHADVRSAIEARSVKGRKGGVREGR